MRVTIENGKEVQFFNTARSLQAWCDTLQRGECFSVWIAQNLDCGFMYLVSHSSLSEAERQEAEAGIKPTQEANHKEAEERAAKRREVIAAIRAELPGKPEGWYDGEAGRRINAGLA
jgi:hypothetical protein